MEEKNEFKETVFWNAASAASLLHPDDVLADANMSKADKKTLLANWASDVRAVKDAPSCRQLDSGAVVKVDDIMRALRTLDGVCDPRADGFRRPPYYARRRNTLRARLRDIFRRGPDDDDTTPPPCPVISRPQPGGSSAAAAELEWA